VSLTEDLDAANQVLNKSVQVLLGP